MLFVTQLWVQIGWILEPKCDAKVILNFQLNKFGRGGWEEMAICPHLMTKNTHVGGGNDELLEWKCTDTGGFGVTQIAQMAQIYY